MDVVIRPDAGTAAGLAAWMIAREIRAKPALVLGLAAGRTVESVYARLVRMHREEGLDFSQCRTFNLDEYVGLAAENPHSYRHFMNQHLFGLVNIDLQNTHLPDGMATDLDAECARYEKLLAECGGLDLQLLGIGLNGHLGFNEPLSPFNSRTRVQRLAPMTRARNAPLFPEPGEVPESAITLGLENILDSRQCLLLATGVDKASIVARAVEGAITEKIPATVLQMHTNCTVILDEAAAGSLKAFNAKTKESKV